MASEPRETDHDTCVANRHALVPEAIKAMMALEQSFMTSGLDHDLLALVKYRVSQINDCAFCLRMHSTDLRRHGESELRLYMLSAWRESTLYSDRERAALGWAEALTHLPCRTCWRRSCDGGPQYRSGSGKGAMAVRRATSQVSQRASRSDPLRDDRRAARLCQPWGRRRIAAIYIVRNPDKLAHVAAAFQAGRAAARG